MSRWFRFYDRALDDPKVQRLPPDVFKGWVNLLCLANRNDGCLPALADIAFSLRISEREAESLVSTLMIAGLLDDDGDVTKPHNWSELQFLSDRDPTNAERQKRHRMRNALRNVLPDGYVTPPRADTEQIQSRAETRVNAREAGLKICFPKDGSLLFATDTRWVAIVRKHAPKWDVDRVGSEFRSFCHREGIEFDDPLIERKFTTFCQKQRNVA